MKSYSVTIQMKATEQYFPVVMFIILYKVLLTSESVDEILWCNHSNGSSSVVLSCGIIYISVFYKLNEILGSFLNFEFSHSLELKG